MEALAVGIFGAYFLMALARAFLAIRRRDVASHREWMIRMVSVAVGVSMQRIAAFAFGALTRQGPDLWFSESVWTGFMITVAAGEMWIRYTRRSRVSRPVTDALPAAG